ncbi:hypothetical protein BWI96_06965 [Siphonobacter sp. SORGH_AS_0500]|uniref:hypothetical protein n=1 Tax=Siphonobacter sp. SORGH_AS_0500 TaxID=1864824 RepID=UPI000CA7E03B|nr:hypothetical protein [Siphonobacter sp. SORGH_AS_0500]PKK37097.1 hypothetical protein BWI96_06965 [Siphonobacter sp. SORGH_AS_0500]
MPDKNSIDSLGDYYYELHNGKIIYEITGVKNFLFNNLYDLKKYISITSKPRIDDVFLSTSTYPINDNNFIEKISDYMTYFNQLSKREFNFEEGEYLKNIDEILNTINLHEFKKYRLSIIAITGEAIIKQSKKEAHWDYIVYSNTKEPVIIIENKILIDPVNIVYDEYNKKIKNNNYKINTHRSIQNVLLKK